MKDEPEHLASSLQRGDGVERRIWIDCSDVIHFAMAGNRTVTGIQRVVINLYRELCEAGEEPSVICSSRDGLALVEAQPSAVAFLFEALILGKTDRQQIIMLAAEVKYGAIPWFHAEHDILVLPGAYWIHDRSIFVDLQLRRNLSIVTFIHDVLIWRHPEFFPRVDRPPFLTGFLHVAALSSTIITSSRYVAAEVRAFCDAFGILSPPVQIIGMANAPLAAAPQAGSKVARQLAERTFVLCVGTIEIRKNHILLLHVWDQLHAARGATAPILVFAGKRGWMVDDLFDAIASRSWCRTHLVELGSVDEATLAWLYANCRFTVFPSMAEGWGLPIGESLGVGVPCAAAGTTALPEAGGDLVVYFDPTSAASALSAVEQLLDDNQLYQWLSRVSENFRPLGWSDWTRRYRNALDHLPLAQHEPPLLQQGVVYTFEIIGEGQEHLAVASARMLGAGWESLTCLGAAARNDAMLHLTLDPRHAGPTNLTLLVSSESGVAPTVHAGEQAFVCVSAIGRDRWLFRGALDNLGSGEAPIRFAPAVQDQVFVLHAWVATSDSHLGRDCLRSMLNSWRAYRFDYQTVEPCGASCPGPRRVTGLLRRALDGWNLVLARRAARSGNWVAAARNYERLCRRPGAMSAHWTQYGHACKEAGNLVMARDAYRIALKLNGDADTRFHFNAVSAMLADAQAAT